MNRMFFPRISPLVILLILLIPLLLVFFLVNAINTAFMKLGFSPWLAFGILFASLIGSRINFPITKGERKVEKGHGSSLFFGRAESLSTVQETVIAVNLGGAIIPLLVSLYLLANSNVPIWKVLIGIVAVTAACYRFARPVPKVGIGLPLFMPPIMSAAVAMVLSHAYAPVIAYVSGVLGVLIGADLLNLPKIANLGAPMASIGGAGTFDGIFLTGVISVLLV
ncbi:MAG: DUF1614 domain-containing protein [Euryarchaeota archaeon]|nr:DUF1614 domain-containing protein [Euryarchaeota archaeon]